MEHSPLESRQTNYYDYVFKNQIESDVQFIVRNNNEEKVIKCHKQVLGQLNLSFLNTFTSQPQLKKFEILDLDPEAFQIFIDFLYTGHISVVNISEELFLVANKYADPTLKNICRKQLGTNFNTENVVRRFLTFFECKDTKLIRAISKFLLTNYNDVKKRFEFQKIVEKPQALEAIFDVIEECNVTVLTKEENPTRKNLIDSATKSNLTIKVQNDFFLAHKNILSARSSFFKSSVPNLPSTRNVCSSIRISDFDASIFKIFLQYIYTRKVEDENISKELLKIAHKYGDSGLQKICEDKLVLTISEENAIELLLLGTDVDSKTLREGASKIIAEKYFEMKDRNEFQLVKQNDAAVDAIFSQFARKIDDLNKNLTTFQNAKKGILHNSNIVIQKSAANYPQSSQALVFPNSIQEPLYKGKKVKLLQAQDSQKQVPGLNVDKKVLRMANGKVLIWSKSK